MSRHALLAAMLLAGLATLGAPRDAGSRQVTDPAGRTVEVPDRPGRIVSLAPNVTEILFAVGAGDQVAGVTDFCDWPPEARSRARVGGYINPSLEAVVALRPDLVVATVDGNQEADVNRLRELGLAVAVIDTPSLDRLLKDVEFLGDLTGHAARGREIAVGLRRRVEAVAAAVGARPRPRTLFLVGISPLVGVGPGTFLDRLLEAAGGANVLGSSPLRYPLIGAEQILDADPDVILADAPGEDVASLRLLPGWAELRAVRDSRVHLLRDDTLLRPGPRVIDGLERLARLLHPGAFAKGPP